MVTHELSCYVDKHIYLQEHHIAVGMSAAFMSRVNKAPVILPVVVVVAISMFFSNVMGPLQEL